MCDTTHVGCSCDLRYTASAVGQDESVREYVKFCVDGQCVDPVELRLRDVENPATERVCGGIAIGSSAEAGTHRPGESAT